MKNLLLETLGKIKNHVINKEYGLYLDYMDYFSIQDSTGLSEEYVREQTLESLNRSGDTVHVTDVKFNIESMEGNVAFIKTVNTIKISDPETGEEEVVSTTEYTKATYYDSIKEWRFLRVS